MIRIFVEDISSIENEELFSDIFSSLPTYRQEKIKKYSFKEGKCLSLLAGKLLHDGLNELGFKDFDQKIVVDDNGKPYIPGNPVYFSISHSGTKAMVAISDVEVGCDIQIIDENKISLANNFFTNSECNEISSSNDPTLCFYKMWTLKESYMKITGKGLSLGLKNIPVDGCKINNQDYVSSFYKVDKNYVACYILKSNRVNLVFDCDGTLINSYEAISDNIARGFKKFGVECNLEEIKKLCLLNYTGYCIEKIANENNINIDDADAAFLEVGENQELITLYDGCTDILSNKRFNCFVYTHRGNSSNIIFKKLGISNSFSENVNSTYHLKHKPDPEGVNYLIDKYGLDKDRTYYVGDRLIDIKCGNAAGIKTIFFKSSGLDIDCSEATFVINSLLDILKLPL